MTTDFVHLNAGGTLIVHRGDNITGSYRSWVLAVVTEYHETMTLKGVSEAERRMQELEAEG